MKQHAAGIGAALNSDGLGSLLGQAAPEGSASATMDVHETCRAPRVHDAWRQSSSGVFTTCPMCYRETLADRPLTHH
jgi:hypothetical protein